jgi:hypothetical protein
MRKKGRNKTECASRAFSVPNLLSHWFRLSRRFIEFALGL